MKRILPVLLILCLLAFVLDIMLGSVWIPFDEVFSILIGSESEKATWENIVINYRLPRAITAFLAGVALSISGLMMQTFFRNPLAGPFVLGISSGASLGVAIVVFLTAGFGFAGAYIDLSIPIGAILGSTLVFMVVLYFANLVEDHTSLLIIGLMFSSATSALVSIMQYFSNPEDIRTYLLWTFGDLGSVGYADLKMIAPIIGLGCIGSVLLIKPLNILLIGNTYAKNAGLNLRLTRYLIISLTALFSGVITAYCGPIAFVGLASPHVARMILDSSDHKKILPSTALIGALALLFCDVIARIPGMSQSLPLNAITSLFGGPLVIWLIVKKKNIQNSF